MLCVSGDESGYCCDNKQNSEVDFRGGPGIGDWPDISREVEHGLAL